MTSSTLLFTAEENSEDALDRAWLLQAISCSLRFRPDEEERGLSVDGGTGGGSIVGGGYTGGGLLADMLTLVKG